MKTEHSSLEADVNVHLDRLGVNFPCRRYDLITEDIFIANLTSVHRVKLISELLPPFDHWYNDPDIVANNLDNYHKGIVS